MPGRKRSFCSGRAEVDQRGRRAAPRRCGRPARARRPGRTPRRRSPAGRGSGPRPPTAFGQPMPIQPCSPEPALPGVALLEERVLVAGSRRGRAPTSNSPDRCSSSQPAISRRKASSSSLKRASIRPSPSIAVPIAVASALGVVLVGWLGCERLEACQTLRYDPIRMQADPDRADHSRARPGGRARASARIRPSRTATCGSRTRSWRRPASTRPAPSSPRASRRGIGSASGRPTSPMGRRRRRPAGGRRRARHR